MQTITSISGGKTSAYLAANYPTDYNVFALVRIEDEKCKFPDEKVRQIVEDRIQKPFIATAEDDTIVYTILDLEQYLGKQITWVSGITFDEVIRDKGGWLPNVMHRYCTQWLKIAPIFEWWAETFDDPITTQIGYRANEGRRVKKMLKKLNPDGALEFKSVVGEWESGPHKGKQKWEQVPWQIPSFPLFDNRVYKDNIERYWEDKPVRFAPLNNCVHCFHRNPLLLHLQSLEHPTKMEWAANQEGGKNGYWRNDKLSYKHIIQHNASPQLTFNGFSECDSGFCEL